jgi:murein DD-endopeptidase MepM/ murein hydrolase activator NlpD
LHVRRRGSGHLPLIASLAVVAGLSALAVGGQPTAARPASTPAPVPAEAFRTFEPPSQDPTPSESPSETPQPLAVPPSPTVQPTPPAGPTHTVQSGDNLWEIAAWHQVGVSTIVRWNPTANPRRLVAGEQILIPGGAPMPPRLPARPRTQTATVRRTATAPTSPAPIRRTVAPPIRGAHVWPLPVTGLITTPFSAAHPGIDIAAPAGTTVRATAAGTVEWAGWKDNGGGYVVVIRHPGGMISTYNHNERVLVRAGQLVGAGQRISLLGSTGNSTGPHLDFRIQMGSVYVNPLVLF